MAVAQRGTAPGSGEADKHGVAVGIMVTHNPLHRSRRAALPHRAPALGSDGKAVPGIRVADTRGRKPAVDIAVHPLPREVVSLTATPERAVPQSPHFQTEGADRS